MRFTRFRILAAIAIAAAACSDSASIAGPGADPTKRGDADFVGYYELVGIDSMALPTLVFGLDQCWDVDSEIARYERYQIKSGWLSVLSDSTFFFYRDALFSCNPDLPLEFWSDNPLYTTVENYFTVSGDSIFLTGHNYADHVEFDVARGSVRDDTLRLTYQDGYTYILVYDEEQSKAF